MYSGSRSPGATWSARGPIQRAGDQGTLTADERPDARVDLAALAPLLARLAGRAAGEGFERHREAASPHRVAVVPLAHPPHQEAKLLDGLGHLLPAPGIPGATALPQRAGDGLEPAGGARDGLLRGHERGAPQYPARPQEVLRRGRVVAPREQLEPVETFSGLEREEIRRGEGVGHRR